MMQGQQWMLACTTAMGFFATFVVSRLLLGSKHSIIVAIKPELAARQRKKAGTPSVGGIAFILGTLPAVLFLDPKPNVVLVAMLLFGLIGFLDDLAKTHHANGDGLSSRGKLLLQMLFAFVVLSIMERNGTLSTVVTIPLVGTGHDWGMLYRICAFFFILYFVNAVNITDGLDGLAAGSSLPILVMLALVGIITQNGEAVPVMVALSGSLVAFLVFNLKPAKYFMGDCGSHALGAVIGVGALVMHVEFAVLIAGFVFLVEFSTSLIQIIAIRSTGRKVFSIAPLHHAYELKGVGERHIVRSYVLVSCISTFVAFLTLIPIFMQEVG